MSGDSGIVGGSGSETTIKGRGVVVVVVHGPKRWGIRRGKRCGDGVFLHSYEKIVPKLEHSVIGRPRERCMALR